MVQAERGERRISRWWNGGMQPFYPTGGKAPIEVEDPEISLVSSPDPKPLTRYTKSNFLPSTVPRNIQNILRNTHSKNGLDTQVE